MSDIDELISQNRIIGKILMERDRQDKKWGQEFEGRHHSFWFTILLEEIGEAAKAILEKDTCNLQEELIQSAAVIVSWLQFFDGAVDGDNRI